MGKEEEGPVCGMHTFDAISCPSFTMKKIYTSAAYVVPWLYIKIFFDSVIRGVRGRTRVAKQWQSLDK